MKPLLFAEPGARYRRYASALLVALAVLGFGACSDSSGPEDQARDRILFRSSRAGATGSGDFESTLLYGIYQVNSDGSGLVELTAKPGWPMEFLDVTPDFRTLIFQAGFDFSTTWYQGNCGNQIWTMGTDGSNARQLTSGWCGTEPILSPSGREFLFMQGAALHVANLDGSEVRKVADAPSLPCDGGYGGIVITQPVGWLSANHISFGRPLCGPAGGGIYHSVDTHGNDLVELDFDPWKFFVSPNQQQVVLEQASGSVTVTDADGSNARVIGDPASLPGQALTWVVTGPTRSMVGHSARRSPWSPDGGKLIVLDPVGHHVVDVGSLETLRLNIPATYLFRGWAGDSEQLLFEDRTPGEAVSNLVLVPLDGTPPVQLTTGPFLDLDPIWIPHP